MYPRRSRPLQSSLCLCCLALAGCGDSGSGTPSRTDPSAQDARDRALERRQIERAPAESSAATKGEVPGEVLERIRSHLAQRTGASSESFGVVRSEWHEWPSGAMGCPQPGMNYTQSTVRGYWIVLEHGGREYDYRVAESGHFVLCEGTALDDPPTL